MAYDSQDIRSYCGHCKRQWDADLFKCPHCGSHLVNFNSSNRSEELAVHERWKKHNSNFTPKN